MKTFADYKELRDAWKADKKAFDGIIEKAYAIRAAVNPTWMGDAGKDVWWTWETDPDTMSERITEIEGTLPLVHSVEKGDKRCLGTMVAEIGGEEYEGVIFDAVDVDEPVSVLSFKCDDGSRAYVYIASFDPIGDGIKKFPSNRPGRVDPS